jgi:hypothetical protein
MFKKYKNKIIEGNSDKIFINFNYKIISDPNAMKGFVIQLQKGFIMIKRSILEYPNIHI